MGGRSSKDALKDARKRAEERVGTLQVSGRYHRLPRKLSDDYSLTDTVLGTGFGGSVLLATSRRPDRQGRTSRFAVKSIKLHHKASRRTLAAEVEVFLSVDHPHVCRLLDVYESEKSLDLVMECLEGGELYQRVNAGKFAEKDAADAAYQMLLAIRYLHNLGIVHRDIKLENFLYTEVGSTHLKLIDFGFSKAWDPEQKKMKLSCGTICYVAPEVILQSYTNMCDMWSLGVVVFLLLVGYMPFPVLPDIEETELNILNGRFKYDARKWKGVSKSSFDFVSKLLQRDPDQRMTAEQALAHPWIAEREQFPSGTESAGLDASVVHSLAEYSRASKFRRTCMQVMAWSLNNAEMAEVREAFMELDVQKTGAIQLHQLKSVLEERFNICDEETRKIFEALDSSNNEEVGYSEFLAAMMSSRIQVHEDLVRAAFQRYDEDDTGYISVENLRQVLTESLDSPETAEEMLSGVSVFAGAEQRVSFDAFIEYLTGGEADESHKRAVGFVIDKQMSRMSSSELMRMAPTLRHCPLTPKGLNRAKSTPFMMVEDSSDDEAKKEIPMSPFLTTPNPVKQTKVPSLVDTTEAAANAKQLEEVPESPPPTVPTPAVKPEVKSSVCAIL